MSTEVSEDLVLAIYGWFLSAMRSVGRNVKPPHCKDVSKTYQFRWIKTFADRCFYEWQLDNTTTKMLVYDVVRYAADRGLLNKGAQVLCMGTILDICRRSLQEAVEADISLTAQLTRCQTFLTDKSKDNLVQFLVEPVNIGGYSHSVYWFNQGYLT